MKEQSVLVVDDEPDIRHLLQEILEDEGYLVSVAATAKEARVSVTEHPPDLVLLDIWMPDEDGVSLLKSWNHSGDLSFPVIMISGHGTVETAVEATKHGAVDFIEKPLSLAKLLLTVEKALSVTVDAAGSVESLVINRALPSLVGESAYMQNLRKYVEQHRDTSESLLLVGEAGSGCELFARHLHESRERGGSPFLRLRCDSLSLNNCQRELFGEQNENSGSAGYIESALHGTLFLDNIELMPAQAQTALSQALEQKAFYRVGSTSRIALQTRLISASRVDLAGLVTQGRFDATLLHQLSVVRIDLMPLREHREDISALLESMVNWHVEVEGLPYRHFTVAAQNRLRNLDWPGNLPELKNLVQRTLILGGGIDVEVSEIDRLLGMAGNETADGDSIALRHDLPLREARANFEKKYLLRCLQESRGNIGDLAKHVGMERTHLYRKLRSLDIDLEKVRE